MSRERDLIHKNMARIKTTARAGAVALALAVLRIAGDENLPSTASAQELQPVSASPMLIVGCQFSDGAKELKSPEHFRKLIGVLDNFWDEVRNGRNPRIPGEFKGFYPMPHPLNWYGQGKNFDKYRAAIDCIERADPTVDFRRYPLITLSFNSQIGDEAIFTDLTLDGVRKERWIGLVGQDSYPDGYAHEQGHELGFVDTFTSDGITRDPYDLMGVNSGNPAYEGEYMYMPQHPSIIHKAMARWVSLKEINRGTSENVVLQRRAQPVNPNGDLGAKIVLTDRHFLTLEYLERQGFDKWAYNEGVLVHEVNFDRSLPISLVVDPRDPTGDSTGPGSVLTQGELLKLDQYGVEIAARRVGGGIAEVTVGNQVPIPNITPSSTPTSEDATTQAKIQIFLPSVGNP